MPSPGDRAHLAAQRADLLRFAQGARHELGFGWLDESGQLVAERPVELWITCRMTHVMSLGVLAEEPPAPGGPDQAVLTDLAAHGVRALTSTFADEEHGGWFAAVGPRGPVEDAKQAYAHAFVCLAASSAAAAGISGSDALLREALDVHERHFWDDEVGLAVEEWDRAWTVLDDYRGVNANMHTVEAYLAVGDVLGDAVWHHRAGRIAANIVGWARANDWRIPEHFDSSWTPMLDYNRDRPADPFRPFGATVGHGLEWARLLVAVDASLGQAAPDGLLEAAVALTERAVADGWAADGVDGFVYTTDWQGRPVVRERMHWVLAEAVNTAETLRRVTGDNAYADHADRWWTYIDRYFVDREHGSWRHELGPDNFPSAEVWAGKPDVYHAYQTALLPELPIVPSFAAALADGSRPARTTTAAPGTQHRSEKGFPA
ncbi:Mannose or cellobiose epimerase, N-acyl-D-glucosamine 2-epimerase family [Actinopolyspora alba]|uniref:Mannose or cellobiose epimerase, N-acyl-D-glucosamine 2-epimerase family n=1 Tax=Actinopolyspora alba TaxID=673379 RepID=A0A1I1X2W7_9ACTN|nr:AGE family epimerase/isomerase [Actinopolyspora alba]SFE00013.1 Mannose or cellobiose epimerase, N-acyl-D-glucosamine 2-epimerase family [Actinopolyspora alba]